MVMVGGLKREVWEVEGESGQGLLGGQPSNAIIHSRQMPAAASTALLRVIKKAFAKESRTRVGRKNKS